MRDMYKKLIVCLLLLRPDWSSAGSIELTNRFKYYSSQSPTWMTNELHPVRCNICGVQVNESRIPSAFHPPSAHVRHVAAAERGFEPLPDLRARRPFRNVSCRCGPRDQIRFLPGENLLVVIRFDELVGEETNNQLNGERWNRPCLLRSSYSILECGNAQRRWQLHCGHLRIWIQDTLA